MIRFVSSAAIAIIAALSLSNSVASAQSSTDERARLHFQSGAAYYDAGEYEAALREFESAYQLSRRPQLFYNMYLCEQAIGNLENAASHLSHFLSEVEEIENRASLESRLLHLQERVSRRAAGEPEPSIEEEASPPEVIVSSEPPSERGPNVGAIAGFSVAAFGLVSAAIFGPLTIAEDDSIASSACGMTGTCTGEQTSTLTTYALLTDISFGVALAGAIVGGVLLLIDPGATESEHASLRITPLAGTSVLGVSIGGAL